MIDPAIEKARQHSEFNHCDERYSCRLCFNNFVDHANNIVWMLTPKVATVSVLTEINKIIDHHLASWRPKDYVLDNCKHMLKIGFVRNPWDRLVSCWKDKIINQHHRTFNAYDLSPGIDFDEFARKITDWPHKLSDKHWRSQSYDLYDGPDQIPDYLVRLERIAYDWDMVTGLVNDHSGHTLGRLEHKHMSNRAHYSEYYDQDLSELVGDYYKSDITNFNYEFESCPTK